MNKPVIVLKISGKTIAEPESPTLLFKKIKTLCEKQANVILVHGGGVQIEAILKSQKVKTQKIDGLRKTDSDILDVIQMAYGMIAVKLGLTAKKFGLNILHLNGLDANLLTAENIKPVGKYGKVGEVKSVNTEIIEFLLDKKFVLLVSPLAADDKGELLNINADNVALSIAQKISAHKLIFITDEQGVYTKNHGKKEYLLKLDISEMKKLTKAGVIQGGMAPKLNYSAKALEGGVKEIFVGNIKNFSSLFLKDGSKNTWTQITN